MNDLTKQEREIYEELSCMKPDEKDTNVGVLKKAIKQLLYKLVPYDQTVVIKSARVKGNAIKFERVCHIVDGEEIYKYELLIEIKQSYPALSGFSKDDCLEFGALYKKCKGNLNNLSDAEQRRFRSLKSSKIAKENREHWLLFSKNIGNREVEISFNLNDSK